MAVKHNAKHQFVAGINSASEQNPASVLPFTHPSQQGWKTYYVDLANGTTPADDAFYDITALGSGTFGPGGSNSILLTAQATTDNTGYNIRHNVAGIQVGSATKKFYLETIIMLTHASGTMAANEWFVGWTNGEASHASGGTAWDFEDGFGFGQLDAGTPVFVTNTTDSEQSVALSGTLVTATFRKYAVYFDGTNYNIYEDDVLITKVVTSPAVVADTQLGFQIHFKVGEAKTNKFEMKYALLAVEL